MTRALGNSANPKLAFPTHFVLSLRNCAVISRGEHCPTWLQLVFSHVCLLFGGCAMRAADIGMETLAAAVARIVDEDGLDQALYDDLGYAEVTN